MKFFLLHTLGNFIRICSGPGMPGKPACWTWGDREWWFVRGQYRRVTQKPDNHRENVYDPPLVNDEEPKK